MAAGPTARTGNNAAGRTWAGGAAAGRAVAVGAAGSRAGSAVHRVPLLRHLRPRHPARSREPSRPASRWRPWLPLWWHRPGSAPPAPFPTISGILTGVTATSADSAWAVGCSGTKCTKALTLRWNGTTWTQVPNPSPAGSRLESVTAMSDGSAWAIGDTGTNRTLILRWNGAAWRRVPSPSVGLYGDLISVTGASADSAWAVGVTEQHAVILRWNGVTWTRVPKPAGSVFSRWPSLGQQRLGARLHFPRRRPQRPGVADPALERRDLDTSAQPEPRVRPDRRRDRRLRRYRLGVRLLRHRHRYQRHAILQWNGATWTRVPSPGPEWRPDLRRGRRLCRYRLGRRPRRRQGPVPDLERHGLDAGAQPRTQTPRLFFRPSPPSPAATPGPSASPTARP